MRDALGQRTYPWTAANDASSLAAASQRHRSVPPMCKCLEDKRTRIHASLGLRDTTRAWRPLVMWTALRRVDIEVGALKIIQDRNTSCSIPYLLRSAEYDVDTDSGLNR